MAKLTCKPQSATHSSLQGLDAAVITVNGTDEDESL